MSVAPWCHKCIICDILQFRGYSINYADCSMKCNVRIVHLFFWTLSEISGLLAVFWDLNFYTGPKMERLERGWYPRFWIQTGARQTIIVYKSSHECQESVVLAISFNGHFLTAIISPQFFFYVHILCIAFSLVWLKGIQGFFFWLCPRSFSQPHLRSQCRISSQNALACIWGPSAADFQLFD